MLSFRSSTPQQPKPTAQKGGHSESQLGFTVSNHLLKCRNEFYGMAIGAMVLAASYAAGPVSGGLINPAITVGVELVELPCTLLSLHELVVDVGPFANF